MNAIPAHNLSLLTDNRTVPPFL